MGAGCAAFLAALDHLFAKSHPGSIFRSNHSLAFELGASEDQEPTEIVLVQVSDRVEEIAVEGHLKPLRVARRA